MIKTILYQLKKRPLLTTMLIFVITFVMTFLSATYSSMNYNKKVYRLINGGHDSKNTIEYSLVRKDSKNKKVNKEALKKLSESCDIELSFLARVDSVVCNTKVNYLSNRKPEILLYDKREIKKGEFNKAYLGSMIANDYKGTISILGKEYPVAETVGIKGNKSKLDFTCNIYVDNIEDLYYIITNADLSVGGEFNLYRNNKNYSTYDKDLREVFNEKNYYIGNGHIREEKVKDLKFGFEYISLILIGVVSIIAISAFWISDRSKDIAIKRAFGAKNKDIAREVYKELMSLSVLCGIIGFTINYFFSKWSNDISSMLISVNIRDTVFFFITILLVSSIVAIIPIHKSKEMDIVNGLKGR